jgi:hypothetical protein
MSTSFRRVFRNLRETLWMDCREASRAQSEMLDHPLHGSRRLGLRLHVAICGWCRRYGKQIRILHETTHDHAEDLSESSPHGLSDEARARIKQRLQDRP